MLCFSVCSQASVDPARATWPPDQNDIFHDISNHSCQRFFRRAFNNLSLILHNHRNESTDPSSSKGAAIRQSNGRTQKQSMTHSLPIPVAMLRGSCFDFFCCFIFFQCEALLQACRGMQRHVDNLKAALFKFCTGYRPQDLVKIMFEQLSLQISFAGKAAVALAMWGVPPIVPPTMHYAEKVAKWGFEFVQI